VVEVTETPLALVKMLLDKVNQDGNSCVGAAMKDDTQTLVFFFNIYCFVFASVKPLVNVVSWGSVIDDSRGSRGRQR